ncbi:BREX-2 system adenine-specific DNA-methyltransferase PglX [Streptomyces sp. NBC_00963]|uniref:BREX-2 system adenine-specific DNA-methyltransferase PglX n=1 Tax=Streptomyces sp. NBC_00963 TaxID=2903697 RepID=UPI00386A796F|nr:BREX-2 system adenine-specific DNA-methyltransferase PglX [Streptomyces sp. NBC_00963]
MIDRERLLKDLQKQVKRVEEDLKVQLKRLPEIDQRLREEHQRAFKAGRTAAGALPWIAERVTQAAVAWVLGTVFVRFCEDNFLIRNPYLTGPGAARQTHAQERHNQFMSEDAARTHRDWLLVSFNEIGKTPAGRLLFDGQHNPLHQLPLSNEGAKSVIDFWRLVEEASDGEMRVVHDFTDPEWDTRFLGNLYQNLDAAVRDKYALFQTPEFVEEFILDRTLEPAINEFRYDVVKMIDPTCGSGHFLLGAFHRLLKKWEENAPNLDVHDRVRSALDAVHGVDLNPHAIAIARFRLLVAAFKAAGITTLRAAGKFDWPIHLAVGDALLKSRQEVMFDIVPGIVEETEEEVFLLATEDIGEHLNILQLGRYHVVVGNPPYVAVKDSKLRDSYRSLYGNVCHGRYALSVPFMQRFFELAVRDDYGKVTSGYVGQITSNSFMKREFGEKMVAGYLKSTVDLTEVIDSSGAYIPHHGTPTVIVIGRNRFASLGARTVRTARGIQGEPETPKNAAQGHVWRDIVERVKAQGKSVGSWVSVDNLERKEYFGRHPWILADGGVETIRIIDECKRGDLKRILSATVGITAVTGEDDLYLLPMNGAAVRMGVKLTRQLVTGDVVRDYQAAPDFDAIWTYGEGFGKEDPGDTGGAGRALWAGKSIIRRRKRFGTPMVERGLNWYEWQELYLKKLDSPLSIAFAEVSTHNHFILDRGGKVFNRTAPVVKLPEGAAEGEYLQLLGPLNSSIACFWLKQMCHNKGSTVDVKGARQSREPFDDFYQFNSTNVQEFPLPAEFPLARATELDSLAQQLTAVTPASVAADPEKPPTADVLADAQREWLRIRARMIAVQEELDWEVYSLYGLHKDLTAPEGSLPADGLALGERAFEIDLGRRVNADEAKTEWFRRHNSTMIDAIPETETWPEAYKETVQRRLDAMQNSNVIGLIERPEYKRRWLTDGWDTMQQAALKEWLLARMERRELWYEPDHQGIDRPRTRSVAELVERLAADEAFTAVTALFAPGQELKDIVAKLVEDQHVPFLAALRYKKPAMDTIRPVWEQVWRQQRAEDEATAAGDHLTARDIREATPVPTKYKTSDFRKASYAAQRGGLDVPRERFISYSRTLSPTIEVLGWGGWNHEEQATALTQTIEDRRNSGNWEKADFTPYLAGLLEVLFWVDQWHPDDAGFFHEVLQDWQHEEEFGITDEELRAWRPAEGKGKGAGKSPAETAPAQAAAAKKTTAKKTTAKKRAAEKLPTEEPMLGE